MHIIGKSGIIIVEQYKFYDSNKIRLSLVKDFYSIQKLEQALTLHLNILHKYIIMNIILKIKI